MLLEKTVSYLAYEFEAFSRLYDTQPALTKQFLDQQAAEIISALEAGKSRIRYQLPDRITLEGGSCLIFLTRSVGVRSKIP